MDVDAILQVPNIEAKITNVNRRLPIGEPLTSIESFSTSNQPEEDPPVELTQPPFLEEEHTDGDKKMYDECEQSTPLKLAMSDTEDDSDKSFEKRGKHRRRLSMSSTGDGETEAAWAIIFAYKRGVKAQENGEGCLMGWDEGGDFSPIETIEAEEEPVVAAIEPIEPTAEKRRADITETHIPIKKSKQKSSDEKATQLYNETEMLTSPAIINEVETVKEETAKQNVSPKETETNKTHIVADTEENTASKTSHKKIRSSVSSAPTGGTPRPKAKQTDLMEGFQKPFQYGWKRELVWRSTGDAKAADVYFYTPNGKKLRSRSEVAPYLTDDLTLDHFCFSKITLNVGPEFETIRKAKPANRSGVSTSRLSLPPRSIGKRVSKPKAPKGASPPPEGWTPTQALKTNNAALLSTGVSSSRQSSSNNHVLTPTSSRTNTSSSSSSKSSKSKSVNQGSRERSKSHKPCTIQCPKATGQVPQLQCVKCCCLYHHECVGLNRLNSEYRLTGTNSNSNSNDGRDYVCEACLPKVEKIPKVIETQISITPTTTATPQVLKRVIQQPQSIAVVKGKKYVMLAQSTRVEEKQNDIENDLKQINDGIRDNHKTGSRSSDTSQSLSSLPSSQIATQAVDTSNTKFATNFFANTSFAFDALINILKYLKIHERSRAASVCKLWNIAAKDTTLWKTVRMKNAKVSDWECFAASLRRGETRHLDLRKMLIVTSKAEEMWNDFLEHIGTVCSLETIDLCRCSARVVESLFLTNKKLRVLNALAINDDVINLENIVYMQELKELRLRTIEAGVIGGELNPLQCLDNLTHLSITAIRGLGAKGVDVFGELVQLRSLELGECGDFDSTFAKDVLPKLNNLNRLRLENGTSTNCDTLEILESVANLKQLTQLELVNFDIQPTFDDKLRQCTNIKKLLIIPTYISQSATTNRIMLSAVQKVPDTLKVFTWGVTIELLRVTALYMDQCKETSKKKKVHVNERIPVLKPVPGALPALTKDEEEETEHVNDDADNSELPQLELLPLDKIEAIMAANMPNTKFTIVKMPYNATCRQQLVE
ncbi:uncharacterized protein LOC119669363 isoform X2 [Teleopsis dalmanni]|uniref:uncharacterized protein LOC119669363 isoform X2 n=1 Tax=Teleopsis dalmanni TaxID=139649 RepID=UPI0018CE89E8|nr:uncharacterized protein LOC119669363 isoform X2 [Teleopsis dalmanni]